MARSTERALLVPEGANPASEAEFPLLQASEQERIKRINHLTSDHGGTKRKSAESGGSSRNFAARSRKITASPRHPGERGRGSWHSGSIRACYAFTATAAALLTSSPSTNAYSSYNPWTG